ncbi:MAG: transglycosylase domain-containing protein, partial [Lachnospiraceae bacterium]|nr:transglycosylase domain-containing protein [Lachnospiraceae bacterium]
MDYGRERVRKQYNSRNTATGKFASRVVMDGLKILFLLMVLAAVVGGAFLVGTVRGIIKTAPPADTLTVTPLGIASVIYDANGLEKETLVASGSNRDPVSYDRIPQDLIDAFVAIEDARFWTHEGVDIRGILRSGASVVIRGGLSGGASTITQQLIKNNIFEGGMEKGWGARFIRKFQEQNLALMLEKTVSKGDILINYLNTINLGANSLGVQVAARRYFGKDVSLLSLSECACIAGIT